MTIDGEITLISESYTKNADRAVVRTETKKTIMCRIQSVSRGEFYSAAQAGLDVAYVFVINPINYNAEKVVEYEGKRYGVTRVYQSSPDRMEIYTGLKVGVYGSDQGS